MEIPDLSDEHYHIEGEPMAIMAPIEQKRFKICAASRRPPYHFQAENDMGVSG